MRSFKCLMMSGSVLERKLYKHNHCLCSKYIMITVVLALYFSQISVTDGAICQKYEFIQNDAAVPANSAATSPIDNLIKVNYTCPRPTDPRHHSECCSVADSKGCCPRSRYFYEIDRTLATIIAVSVTSVCILITIVITICCFWSRCPFYSSCRTEFSPEIATYVSKEDNLDMDTMPREISKKNNKFSPVVISNGNIPSGVDMEAI